MSAPLQLRGRANSFFLVLGATLLALSVLTFFRAREAKHQGREFFAGVRGYVTVFQAQVFSGACFVGSVFCLVAAFGRRPTESSQTETGTNE